MAKPDPGKKHQCLNCEAKFYDLGRSPIVCPKCDTTVEVQAIVAEKPKKPAKPVEVKKEKEKETSDTKPAEPSGIELVSLEEADAEVNDEDVAAIKDADELVETADEDVAKPDGEEDDSFLETDDDNPNVDELIDSGVTKTGEG